LTGYDILYPKAVRPPKNAVCLPPAFGKTPGYIHRRFYGRMAL
jgi:hypothetical protein